MLNIFKLNCGARLVIEEIPHVRSAAAGIYIGVGSRHEKKHMKGASHFVEHMLFKGTGKRSAREIAESFEGIGGQLNAFTAKEFTCLYARTLDENLLDALDILFDMLYNSSFNKPDFETEKGVIIEEINMYEDAPDDLIHDVFANRLWFNHPMGSPILGTLDSVSGFDRNEIYEFYSSAYVPSNMVISIAGNVSSSIIKDRVEKLLENNATGKVKHESIKPQGYNPFVNMVEKDTEQVQICMGVPGLAYHSERRYAQNIMNTVLGGGMSSRLFQRLREQLGLVYTVFSYPSNYSDTGSYSIYIGTGVGRVAQCFEALHDELDNFIKNGITDAELQRTKNLIKSSMYLGLESVMNRMSRIGKSVMMYDEVVKPERVIERVYDVTAAEVQELACELLGKQSISLAAIGPAEVLDDVQKEYRQWWPEK